MWRHNRAAGRKIPVQAGEDYRVITIGIRAAPSAVTFAVYNTDAKEVVNVEQIIIPAAFTTPDRLKYLRSNLLDVLREFKVEQAGVRVTEPSAKMANVDRIQIEGVIQEAFASSDLTHLIQRGGNFGLADVA